MPEKDAEFLFLQMPPNSIIVYAVNSKGYQHHFKSTPYDQNCKRLDLFHRKVYSLSIFQFRVVNY